MAGSLAERSSKYIIKTNIEGLYKIERDRFDDNRGFFKEIFHQDELNFALGYEFSPVQMNHSRSKPKVLRGIHPDPWDKLVYPLTGSVFIAICDIEPKSPTFKKVETFTVDEDNRFALFIKKGLGNSACVLGDEDVHYIYLVNAYWDGNQASGLRAISYNDPDLAIDWPIKDPIISEKDKLNKTLKNLYFEGYPHLFKS